MNNMDTEFMNRLKTHSSVYNLGLRVEADFYHLYHERRDGAADDISQPHALQYGVRKTNDLSIRKDKIKNDNPKDWGLKREKIKAKKVYP